MKCSCVCPHYVSSCRVQICIMCVCVCVLCIFQSVVGSTSGSLGAVQLAEPRQHDASMIVDVAVGALVHPFDQVFLVQQRVVGAERAGGVKEALVVMAELRLPAGRQELVNVHHLAQRHHQDSAWTGNKENCTQLHVSLLNATVFIAELHCFPCLLNICFKKSDVSHTH